MIASRLDGVSIDERAQALGIGARIHLADSLQAMHDALAATDADDETLHRVATCINDARDTLTAAPAAIGKSRLLDGPLMGVGVLSELGPFTTRLHGMVPPIDMQLGCDRVEANVAYGAAHEGGPGVLHGGFIAATFDELLGVTQRSLIRMTGTLTIRYRAPAMLYRQLCYRAWLDRIDGRKAFVKGTLHDGDILCAEAEAVFIELRVVPFDLPGRAV